MVKVGLVPKPAQIYCVATSVAGESNMHGLQDQQNKITDSRMKTMKERQNSTRTIDIIAWVLQ